MITSNLRVNELGPEASTAYMEYLAVLDAKDIARYATYLSDDVSIQFNNAPAVEGKPAVVEMLSGYWQGFRSIEHDLIKIYGSDTAYVLEALNHYERHDGGRVTVRAVAFTDLDDAGLVSSIRVYGDTASVFEGAGS